MMEVEARGSGSTMEVVSGSGKWKYCEVVVDGPNEPPYVIHFIDMAYFQIQFGPIDYCLNWKVRPEMFSLHHQMEIFTL